MNTKKDAKDLCHRLEQEATAQDRANLLEAYGIDLPAGASRKDALFAIRDQLKESAE